jgi:hypothetical protein
MMLRSAGILPAGSAAFSRRHARPQKAAVTARLEAGAPTESILFT